MKIVNIDDAKKQLSKLVEEASKGEPFIIAKAGKPLVKVTALNAPDWEADPKARFHGRTDYGAGRLRRNGPWGD